MECSPFCVTLVFAIRAVLNAVLAFAGTYIPPGPMLNSASTRLACLEDVEVDVSAPGSACRLFRRRVFAPEDNRDERFLTASDVVKVNCSLYTAILHPQALELHSTFSLGCSSVFSRLIAAFDHHESGKSLEILASLPIQDSTTLQKQAVVCTCCSH